MSDNIHFNHTFIKEFMMVPIQRYRNFDGLINNGGNYKISKKEYKEIRESIRDVDHIYISGNTKEYYDEGSSVETPIPMPFEKIFIHSDAKMTFGSQEDIYLKSMLVSTNDYINYEVSTLSSNNEIFKRTFRFDRPCWENIALRGFLEALNRCDSGEIESREKKKVKDRHGKPWFKTNKVIYCCKNKDQPPHKEILKMIDWKHSWKVRGHWRKVKGFGKDPAGNLIRNGFTWVVPHVKGDGVLVSKMRTNKIIDNNVYA